MTLPSGKDYSYQKKTLSSGLVRELVFGMEDGMVSTMGAITGIATATGSHFTVVVSGVVIIAVESISMAVGSYLSNKSEQAIHDRLIDEEREEIRKYPKEEEREMIDLFVKDGWPKELATTMAKEASKNHELMLREMSYRELNIVPGAADSPLKKAWIMGISYVAGGLIPVVPYLVIDNVYQALTLSIPITLVGLFVLGIFTTKFSKRTWWKAGLEMLVLASAAALIGYGVGQLVDALWLAPKQ